MIHKFPFRPCKVLPLVYDESLSYYEFLCKVLAKLNEVVELFNNEFERKIEEINAEWDDLKGDVTAELAQIIAQFEGDKTEIINQIKEEITQEFASIIGEEVTRQITAKLDDYDTEIKQYIEAQRGALRAYIDQQDQAIKDYFNALISNRLFLYTTNIGWGGVLTYNHSAKTAQVTGEMSYIDSTDTHGLWSLSNWGSAVNLNSPIQQNQAKAPNDSSDWFFLCVNMSAAGSPVAGTPLVAVRVNAADLLDFEKYRPLLRYDKATGVPISVYVRFSNPSGGFVYS